MTDKTEKLLYMSICGVLLMITLFLDAVFRVFRRFQPNSNLQRGLFMFLLPLISFLMAYETSSVVENDRGLHGMLPFFAYGWRALAAFPFILLKDHSFVYIAFLMAGEFAVCWASDPTTLTWACAAVAAVAYAYALISLDHEFEELNQPHYICDTSLVSICSKMGTFTFWMAVFIMVLYEQ